jgi:hypothetical protein
MVILVYNIIFHTDLEIVEKIQYKYNISTIMVYSFLFLLYMLM